MHFGLALRLLRLDSGLGLRDLARRLGVSSTYLSRVENGLDAPPTLARLAHMARELGVPAPTLIELAHRVNPFLADYVGRVPDAGALFLELAHRDLNADQLAEVRDFVNARFPVGPVSSEMTHDSWSDLLSPDRIVLGLRCASAGDALDIVAERLASACETVSAAALATALKRRDVEVSGALGAGVAVTSLYLPGAVTAAGLVTFSTPFLNEAGDQRTPQMLFAVVGPPESSHRGLLAQLARLAGRGLVEELSACDSAEQLLTRLGGLERWR